MPGELTGDSNLNGQQAGREHLDSGSYREAISSEQKPSGDPDIATGRADKIKEDGGGVVSWLSLYEGADGLDSVALGLGVLGAVGNGLIFPSFSLVFGEVCIRAVSPATEQSPSPDQDSG